MSTILLIILILLLIGALRPGLYSSGWGYYPSGGIGLIPAHRAHFGIDRKSLDAPLKDPFAGTRGVQRRT